MYVAYTAPHWPLHALEKDIEKYEDIYNMGWDRLREQRLEKQKELGIFDASVELSARDPKIPGWEELPEEEQEEFARRMAIYAAQIDAMDQGIGRIVSKLKELGELDNTLLMFLSDNGACAEYISGGPGKEVTGKANTCGLANTQPGIQVSQHIAAQIGGDITHTHVAGLDNDIVKA